MILDEIPAHVPAKLVRDFDYFDMQGGTDVYQRFRKLHDGPDIFYTPHHGGHWVVTRYDDMEHILSNADAFSSRYETVPRTEQLVTLLESDGQAHTDFRDLLMPYFTPKSIGALEKRATNLTHSLIDSFYDKGECDFVEEFAQKMPIIILMSLCDLPMDDAPYLIQISEELVRSGDPRIQQAAFERVFAYFAEKIVPVRRGTPGKDMISAIIHGKLSNGRSPTDAEILGLCSLLIGGGLDTVASMLGFVTLFLARNPGHRQQLLDEPALIGQAREELVRRHHVVNIARMVKHDMRFHDVDFMAGDIVMTPTTLAGIDERRYPNALDVDFRRADKKHLAFGRGPHQCIGSFLARTELQVFLTEWLQRIPHFEVKPGFAPVSVPGKTNRIYHLPLTWSPV